MILSDQLVVRLYSSHEAWRPGPMLVQGEGDPSLSSHTPAASITPQVQTQLQNMVSDDASPTRMPKVKLGTHI